MTVIAVVCLASFFTGAFANQVVVQQIQSLAGNHVLVPAPELQIVTSVWNINGTVSLITGVTLNVTTVGGPAGVTKVYQIFIQVSCLDPTGKEYTCATGTGTITLPANGGVGRLIVPISPQLDPELIEVHDLSFIVTGSPSPVPTCTPTFNVTASPSVVTVNRTITSKVFVNKTITYTGNCASATISLSAIVKGPSPLVTVVLSVPTVTVPPSPTFVTETIFVPPTATPGPYTVLETDVSGAVVVTVPVTVNVV